MTSTNTILILGASRGLGLALAEVFVNRGWNVIGTVRGDKPAGLHALAKRAPNQVQIEQLDIREPKQVSALVKTLSGRRIDVLFANAGIALEKFTPIADVPPEAFTELLLTNALAPIQALVALEPLVPPTGVLAVMSSSLGSIAGASGSVYAAYGASKAALNRLLYSVLPPSDSRAVLAVSPGWVRTDMGGADAALSPEESATGIADVLVREAGKPGVRFVHYDGHEIAW